MVKASPKTKSVRLPSHIKPEHYWLSLVPDFNKFTYAGEEIITIELAKADSKIQLHAKELVIQSAVVTNGKTEWVAQVSYDETNELAILTASKTLPAGVYNIHLNFTGILNDKMRGFYRSEFKLKGKTEYVAVTQFEPTDARRAFPCFDEPAQKASFTVELTVPQGMEAISNTIIVSKAKLKNGLAKVKFAPTPIMSTYLLAFIIGKFEFIEDLTEDGITVRVFVAPGKKQQAKFALETAKRVLTFFNRYFKVKYPLPTLDMIAIPDFAAAAMENWGAVTYRETAILVDPKNSSTLARQMVCVVIAHELTHQWFGNLVTMQWWTDLWLNEGFASYISYVAVDHLYPEWNMWSQFINSDLGAALELDSLKNTHPIQVEVNHPDEINEIFDEVSYAKGASILRMLADYVGPEKFRDGLRYYLKKHQYGNAKTEDLWRALETVTKKPVRQIMGNWTLREGYPLISVTEKGSRLTLSQKRFYSDPKQKGTGSAIWAVPVTLGDEKVRARVLFNKAKLTLPKPKGKYLKLNIGETGVYRTRYQPSLMKSFLPAIGDSSMATADRLGILRDSIALARSGAIPAANVLDLISHYRQEKKYTAWVEISTTLGKLNNLFKDEKFYPALQKFTREVFLPIVHSVGWEPKKRENPSQALLRGLVLYRAGRYGDPETIKRAQDLYKKLRTKKNAIPADLRGVVYNLVAENGGAKDYEALLVQYRAEPLQEEKNRIARAMGLFQNQKLLKRFLQFTLSKEVRAQDAPLLIYAAWNNRVAGEMVWQFVTAHWKELLKRYGEGGHLLVRLIEPASNFSTERQAKMVSSFFKAHSAPGGERTVQQVVEEIRIQALWRDRDHQKVKKFLKTQGF
jgi:puromycin-sensitive aminopeptidase